MLVELAHAPPLRCTPQHAKYVSLNESKARTCYAHTSQWPCGPLLCGKPLNSDTALSRLARSARADCRRAESPLPSAVPTAAAGACGRSWSICGTDGQREGILRFPRDITGRGTRCRTVGRHRWARQHLRTPREALQMRPFVRVALDLPVHCHRTRQPGRSAAMVRHVSP